MNLRLFLLTLSTVTVSWGQAPPAPKPAAARTPAIRAATTSSYKDLKFPPLHSLALPQVIRHQLANGMKVLLLEDHETPAVTGIALVRTGTVFDPPQRVGVANLTSVLIRGGGTRLKSPEQLELDLDALGASVDSSVTETLATVSFAALKETTAPVLAIFHDLLTGPSFRQDRIDRAKNALQETVSRRNSDPRELLPREMRTLLYGKDSPYAQRLEYTTLAPISRADIQEFYRRYYFPANITLAIAGDFDATEMKGALEALFADWKPQQPPVPAFPKVDAKPALGAHLALKTDIRETFFALGELGGQFDEKDAAAVEVLANILGASPMSRLSRFARSSPATINEISLDAGVSRGYPGMFLVTGSSPSTATADTVRSVVDEIQRIRSTEVTEEELAMAKQAAAMRLTLVLDTMPKAVRTIAEMEYYGYPPDALQQYQKNVMGVTRADVLRVAKERIDPEKLTVVAISNLTVFNKPLDPRGGEAQPLDLTVRAPKQDFTTATAASIEQGKQLLQRAQAASGGVEKLAAVKDWTLSLSYKLAQGGQESETDQWLAPSYLREESTSARVGRLIRFVDGTSGWISDGQRSELLVGFILKQTLGDLLRLHIPLLLSDRAPGRTIKAVDEQTVELAQGDAMARVVFDPGTGLPSQILYEAPTQSGEPVSVEEDLSDYRDVGGIKLPHAVTVYHGGVKYADGVVLQTKLNSGLKLEVLQRRQ